jgi:hypothetical protein
MVNSRKNSFGLAFGNNSMMIILALLAVIVLFIAFVVIMKSKKSKQPRPKPRPKPPPRRKPPPPPPPVQSPPVQVQISSKGKPYELIRSDGYLPFQGGKHPIVGRALLRILKNSDGTNNFEQTLNNNRVITSGTAYYVSIKDNGETTYYGNNSEPLDSDYIPDPKYTTLKINN